MMSINASITSESDFENTPNGLAARWQTEIQSSQQELLKFKEYTKIPMKELDGILKHDIWMDSATCLKHGLVDHVL